MRPLKTVCVTAALLATAPLAQAQTTSAPAPAAPVKVIFDSDMDNDCDDVAALALLHVLADRGEAEILATVGSSRTDGSAKCMSAINTYYGRGDLPIGVPKKGPKRNSKYTQPIANALPHGLKSIEDAKDAVEVYRQVLSAQPDHSVVIATVGFHTNIAALLKAPAEGDKPSGKDLVAKKVRLWACMGGNFIGKPAKDDLKLGNVNFTIDAEASFFAIPNWPAKLVFVGREVASVPSGVKVGKNFSKLPENHPVRLGYEAYFGGTCKDRHVADPATILFAVRGTAQYWDIEDKGYMDLPRSMKFEWKYDRESEQAYLLKKVVDGKPNDAVIEKEIETLVLTPPKHKAG